jgi:2-phosphosulfolactate phosphatase
VTRLDVLIGEASIMPADVVGRVVVVIDVLRAATTVATALSNGARAVHPFGSVEETARRGAEMDRDSVRMAGERRMVRIPGFDFGNSPLEFTRDAVAGRSVLYTTTNGTAALLSTHGARECLFASFVNVSATIDAVYRRAAAGADVTVICAGTDRRVALEDAVCAGRIVRSLLERDRDVSVDTIDSQPSGNGGAPRPFGDALLSDAATIVRAIEQPYVSSVTALAHDATHARALSAAGFGADVAYCLGLDTVPVAVAYKGDRLELH